MFKVNFSPSPAPSPQGRGIYIVPLPWRERAWERGIKIFVKNLFMYLTN